jgi:leader peptidase (prepilin peptidase)/N-methyltransferase
MRSTLPATVACGGDANPHGIAAAVGNTTPAAQAGPIRSTVVSPLLVIFSACFGATTAAFLPRLAHRLAVGHADEPRAGCAICSRPFPPGVSGWVRAGAACSCSGGYAWTIVSGATVAALLAVLIGPSPLLPAYLLAAVPGVLLAVIDLRCLRLPDRLVATLGLTAGVPLAVLRPDRIGASLLPEVLVSVT